jgi:hypothetical protein
VTDALDRDACPQCAARVEAGGSEAPGRQTATCGSCGARLARLPDERWHVDEEAEEQPTA